MTIESLYLHLQRNIIGKQFSHIIECHLLQKVFKLQVLWSSHQSHQPRLMKEPINSENISKNNFSQCYMNYL